MPRQFFIAPLVCVIEGSGMQVCGPKVNPQQVNGGVAAVCQPRTAPNPQCLVLVAGDTSGANADTDLVSLIGENFNTSIASLPNNVRNRINNGLTNKSIPLDVNDYTLVRDFLNALGRFFDPDFTLENFWVSN